MGGDGGRGERGQPVVRASGGAGCVGCSGCRGGVPAVAAGGGHPAGDRPADRTGPVRGVRDRAGPPGAGVEVLERIADGLGVPRVYLRLSGDAENTYPGGEVVTGSPEEVAEMNRRLLLANAGVAFVGQRVDGLGELLTPPDPTPVPLPTRIEGIHVAQVRNTTRQLGRAGSGPPTPTRRYSVPPPRGRRNCWGCRVPSRSNRRCW